MVLNKANFKIKDENETVKITQIFSALEQDISANLSAKVLGTLVVEFMDEMFIFAILKW